MERSRIARGLFTRSAVAIRRAQPAAPLRTARAENCLLGAAQVVSQAAHSPTAWAGNPLSALLVRPADIFIGAGATIMRSAARAKPAVFSPAALPARITHSTSG